MGLGVLGLALGLIVVLFAVWTDGQLLLPRNVSNLVLQNSYILILAIGMMLVIIAGHIDLSVGSLTAFVGAFAAVLMVEHIMQAVVELSDHIVVLALGKTIAEGTPEQVMSNPLVIEAYLGGSDD